MSLSGSESHSRFDIDSTLSITSTQTSRSVNALLVKSVGAHLSVGATASASRSSYFNQDLALQAAPAVEYDVFPYAQSTRRQFTFRYAVGPVKYDYHERTIFDRTAETRMWQALTSGVVFRQPWGSVNLGIEASDYLDDFSRNRLDVGGGVQLNLVRGLAVNLSGSYQRVRDQLYLPAGSASRDEILLRRRQLATGFQYFAAVGFAYTFGSRLSPVVNPRFGGGADGGVMIIN